MEAVILAAGMGRRLNHLTARVPKGLLEVGGSTLLERQVRQLRDAGVTAVTIVVGHGADEVRRTVGGFPGVSFRFNPEFATANVVVSLAAGLEEVSGDFALLLSDFIYADDALASLLVPREERVILGIDDSFACGDEDMKVWRDGHAATAVSKRRIASRPCAKFTGISLFRGSAVGILKNEVRRFLDAGEKEAFYGDVIDSMIRRQLASVGTVAMTGSAWAEINYEMDLERARRKFAAGTTLSAACLPADEAWAVAT